MNKKRYAAVAIAVYGGWLLLGVVGCSRGYKTGSAITPAALAEALPEFAVTLPPGGTNLYLEHDSRPPLINSWLKVAVPILSLTNFLHSFGFSDEFMTTTPQMIRLQNKLQAVGELQNVAAWYANAPRHAHHATEWDPGKGSAPLRQYGIARPGTSSTNEPVILFAYVNAGTTNNAIVYLEYHRLHKSVSR